jgi:hypothetical protein
MQTVAQTINELVNGALNIEKNDGKVFEIILKETRKLDLKEARKWKHLLRIGIAHMDFLEELTPHQKNCAVKAVTDLIGPSFFVDHLIYYESRGNTLWIKIQLQKSVTRSADTWSHFCATKYVPVLVVKITHNLFYPHAKSIFN